ncbi:ester cyclase [Actinophytocola gossypii]|uniref:Ester cyclase n=1 Tax=Actinophytocola gossypii TaxID=2812003 RepID=A0ABT2J9I8_9PSEU|nr:ester cyclase [Actinophytocola gossypii]MCT2584532.1 hypothetical protein [Actinophytocola gossypii]
MIAASGRVAVRGELTATHRGKFHQIENGRIVRSWHIEDLHGWIRQMKA